MQTVYRNLLVAKFVAFMKMKHQARQNFWEQKKFGFPASVRNLRLPQEQ